MTLPIRLPIFRYLDFVFYSLPSRWLIEGRQYLLYSYTLTLQACYCITSMDVQLHMLWVKLDCSIICEVGLPSTISSLYFVRFLSFFCFSHLVMTWLEYSSPMLMNWQSTVSTLNLKILKRLTKRSTSTQEWYVESQSHGSLQKILSF